MSFADAFGGNDTGAALFLCEWAIQGSKTDNSKEI
jgi:hypothetical protein